MSETMICAGCKHDMRPAGTLARDYPGTRLQQAGDQCRTCYRRDLRRRRTQYSNSDPIDPLTLHRMEKASRLTADYIKSRRDFEIPTKGMSLIELKRTGGPRLRRVTHA